MSVGDGPKTAALVHGMTGDGGTWFEVAPWLVGLGYTVTLVDLRGHGLSPRASSYRASDLGDDLVDTLPTGMDLIAGHSLGGRALVSAVESLRPRKTIYLDPAWTVPRDLVISRPLREDGSVMSLGEASGWAPAGWPLSAAHLRSSLRSQALFDATMLTDPWWPLPDLVPCEKPVVPSLVALADPTDLVPPALADRLGAGGYEIRVVPGAGHDLHVTHLDALKITIDDWV
ncbi:alpha/beta fold hydrolase [Aeromicrobium endophyticum]|uniref:alpha/beta fold hydrolase n=1 Tax=Aeromicrobium endophyticum TaxID=2292704 RepID=UPI001314E307|nr:alpha/beta hydrolase [Aeromicrobium endophyticum]